MSTSITRCMKPEGSVDGTHASSLQELANEVILRLKGQAARLCIVESCTGGLLAHSLTEIPGASAVLWATITAYDNSAKTSLALVPEATLREKGAVSEETALALAQGGLARLKDSITEGLFYSLATTGIAGPGGATSEKPVGLCFVAVKSSLAGSVVVRVENPPDLPRAQQKIRFAQAALRCLLAQIPAPGLKVRS